jgi:hypothetical protein
LSDAGGNAAERVEQRNDLVPGQMRQSGWRRAGNRFLVRKQDLQGRR